MVIYLQIHYTYNDVKLLSRGDFRVNEWKFKQNPDETAAKVANEWIRQLKMEFPGMDILKVLYNETDITELIN